MVDGLVAVVCLAEAKHPQALRCAQGLGVLVDSQMDTAADYHLVFSEDSVYLAPTVGSKHGHIMVDFCAGSAAHRRRFGGGKGQLIAKAVGVTRKFQPHVLDATAGLAGDAFVLATLGCQVTLMERSPVAFALVQDGLARARAFAEAEDRELLEIITRMTLLPGDSINYLQGQSEPLVDVIYLDPMFPQRSKKAAVKKEMQAFHRVIGADTDDSELFRAADCKARYRLVVKRPRIAPVISDRAPSLHLDGKAARFDIYTYRSMPR